MEVWVCTQVSVRWAWKETSTETRVSDRAKTLLVLRYLPLVLSTRKKKNHAVELDIYCYNNNKPAIRWVKYLIWLDIVCMHRSWLAWVMGLAVIRSGISFFKRGEANPLLRNVMTSNMILCLGRTENTNKENNQYLFNKRHFCYSGEAFRYHISLQ